MLKNLLFITAIASFFLACTGNQPADTTQATGEPQSFGEKISADGTMTYNDFLTHMEGVDSMPAKVRATVQEVCQKKGCWMNVTDGQASTEMFVQFKDYGFFMPKDISGREVVMEGYAYREVTSVEDLRHFAEDEGKSKEEIEAITEPQQELKFMASGVLLMPEENKQ